MTMSPRNMHPIPAYSKIFITSPSTPTARRSALTGIRKVTSKALVAPAEARIRKKSKYASAVLTVARPRMAAMAAADGWYQPFKIEATPLSI